MIVLTPCVPAPRSSALFAYPRFAKNKTQNAGPENLLKP